MVFLSPKKKRLLLLLLILLFLCVDAEQVENASLKEHLQRLLNDNQILKRAVAIQHERHLEQEENTNGVLQLKNDLNQYQEKVRSLEVIFFDFLYIELVGCR